MTTEELEFELNVKLFNIKNQIKKIGVDNIYISFSGGKDSMVMHTLIDIAIPNNKIPRVYCNTGIEFVEMVKFVRELQKKDNRFIIIIPDFQGKTITQILDDIGYPFKSKEHSSKLNEVQKDHNNINKNYIQKYLGHTNYDKNICPKTLLYQFYEPFSKFKVSDKCCFFFKKRPLHNWAKDTQKHVLVLDYVW